MKMENAAIGLCVICSQPMPQRTKHICKKCMRTCSVKQNTAQIRNDIPGFHLMDIKSACCNADIIISGSITDSQACHEILIAEMELMHGKFKRVVDVPTGIEYKVPLRLIIEQGITQERLHKFPLWDGNNMI